MKFTFIGPPRSFCANSNFGGRQFNKLKSCGVCIKRAPLQLKKKHIQNVCQPSQDQASRLVADAKIKLNPTR